MPASTVITAREDQFGKVFCRMTNTTLAQYCYDHRATWKT